MNSEERDLRNWRLESLVRLGVRPDVDNLNGGYITEDTGAVLPKDGVSVLFRDEFLVVLQSFPCCNQVRL